MSWMDTPVIQELGQYLDLAAYRQSLISSNLANIDTPGYRTQDVNFSQEMERADGNLTYASFSPVARPVRGLMERPDGNNVSLERESLLLADTQLRFNLGVQLLRDEFKGILSAINGGGQS